MRKFIEKLKNNYQYVLCGGLILFLIIFVINNRNEEKRIHDNGASTICKVYYSAWLAGEGRYICKYYYFVQGNKYYGVEVHYNKNCFIGDYYQLTYDLQKPNINRIDLSYKIPLKLLYQYFPQGKNPFEMDSTKDAGE